MNITLKPILLELIFIEFKVTVNKLANNKIYILKCCSARF